MREWGERERSSERILSKLFTMVISVRELKSEVGNQMRH